MKRKITIKKIIVFLVVTVFIFSLIGQIIVIKRINKNIVQQSEELESLKAKNIKLQDELNRAQEQDIEYLEKLARERLGLIIDGEKIIRSIEPQE